MPSEYKERLTIYDNLDKTYYTAYKYLEYFE